MKRIIRAILSFLIGAIYLSFFDWLQVKYHVENYNAPTWSFLKIPLQFGILTLILSQLVPWFEKDFEFNEIESNIKEVILELLFFALLYLLTLMSVPSCTLMLLFVFLTSIKCLFECKSGDLYYFIILGFLGTALECILIYFKTYNYTSNDMFGVPYWLPLLWGNGGLLARRLFNLPQLKWKI